MGLLAAAVDELPAALALAPGAWQEQYRCLKPGPGAPVVMQCRTNRRAAWAAQLAHDAGLASVFVYKQARTLWRRNETCGQLLPGPPDRNGKMTFINLRCRACMAGGWTPT